MKLVWKARPEGAGKENSAEFHLRSVASRKSSETLE